MLSASLAGRAASTPFADYAQLHIGDYQRDCQWVPLCECLALYKIIQAALWSNSYCVSRDGRVSFRKSAALCVSLLTDKTPKTKQTTFSSRLLCNFGGLKRIRTAVRGFADLCLATRPSDHFRCLVCKYINFYRICKILVQLSANFSHLIDLDHPKLKEKNLSNKALSSSALSENCSFTLSKLRFFSLRAAPK